MAAVLVRFDGGDVAGDSGGGAGASGRAGDGDVDGPGAAMAERGDARANLGKALSKAG